MILLHSSYGKASREFADKNSDGLTIIDWYVDHDKRREYLASGLPSPSSFPSLVDEEKKYIFREPQATHDFDDAIICRKLLNDNKEPAAFSEFGVSDIDKEIIA